ncbi:putative membrane protein [Emticicia oligotrophica DSM 17448]|uniref:Membrane protein n=1 Tax=Emticicia oligotrophica (strain DSM 17448 / CIP 109782 / MTCC 6937 / GPTSA100-15) TaxID=929562 RepID=A0ABM5MYK4_EMTOG|nr:type IX secretion system membrane protein PorP/SprF [Emticicia oligotrophica]AFK02159.1 putative membrane protein [Emticicia oligotrophica DSM 17448]
MKKYLFIALMALTSFVQAQTLLEDQFHFNFLALNPAFAGAKGAFGMNAMLGNQFNGTIRPQQIYQLFSTDGLIQQGNGGLALQAYNSNIAGFNNSGVKVDYAYRKQFGDLFSAAIGADAGFIYQPTLISGLGIKQMYPYAGVGGLLSAKHFYVSLSKPVLFINDEGLFNSKKPFYSMLGLSLGEYDGIMFNTSALIESNKGVGNNFYLTGKAWFARKFGLGIVYRSQELLNFNSRVNKIIPMAEYQVSDAIRLGASYDAKPINYYIGTASSNFQQRGILQIYFRYEGRGDERNENRLKYY